MRPHPAPHPEPFHASGGNLDGLDPARIAALALEQPTGGTGRTWESPSLGELEDLLPDYTFTRVIGRGGMGAVYHAVQGKLDRPVAVKVLPVELGDQPGFVERFRREARAMASLRHPGIVAVFDSGETLAGHLFYVMEYVEGPDLARFLEDKRLTPDEGVSLLDAVCEALAAAHAGNILHRDIKPSNILLAPGGRPKLADFGLAIQRERELALSRLTGDGSLGTLEYASPEQLRGETTTEESDVFSLGVLAYEILTGELPRGIFDPPSARRAEVDTAFDGVVMRALQSDPTKRFPNVEAFRAGLCGANERRGRRNRKLRRRTGLALLAGGIAAVLAGVSAFAVKARSRALASESEAATLKESALGTRAEAEKLVEFMLSELQGRLFEVNRLDVLAEVVSRVESYYASIPPTEAPNDDFLRRKAEFIELKGALLSKQGRGAEAIPLFREAQGMRLQLRPRHASEAAFENGYLDGQLALAYELRAVGHYEEAFEALEVLVRLQPSPGGTAESQSIRMCKAVQADLLFQLGRTAEAETLSKEELAELEAQSAALGRRDRDEFGWQNVGIFHSHVLSSILAERGDFAEAARWAGEAVETLRRFLPTGGERHGYREHAFAAATGKLGKFLLKAGRPREAEESLARGYAFYRRLTADSPGDKAAGEGLVTARAAWIAVRELLHLETDADALDARAETVLAEFGARP